jgi:hypothetical protein
VVLHPSLQFYQFTLQTEQFLEVDAPIDRLLCRMLGKFIGQRIEAIVVDF